MSEEKLEYQWGRLYAEWAEDIKVQSMSEVDQRRHAMLLCMHIRGHLHPTDSEIAIYLRISEKKWKKTKEVFIEKGFITAIDNHLINWERRQFKSDKSLERVRSFRERQRENSGHVTLQKRHGNGDRNVTVTPPEYRVQNTEEEESPPTPPSGGGPGEPASDFELTPPETRKAELDARTRAVKLLPLLASLYGETLALDGWKPFALPNKSERHTEALSRSILADQARADIEFWRGHVNRIRGSGWHMARVPDKNGEYFKARNFDWFTAVKNVDTVAGWVVETPAAKSAGQATYEALKDEVWE